MLTPIVSENLAQMAFERLEAAILSGAMEPGLKMSEASLARQLKISRGPLREAIGRLEGLGLVTRVANQGPRVASLQKAELIELLVLREAVEGMSARYAAANATDQDIQELRSLVASHENDLHLNGDKENYEGKDDTNFHVKISEISRNSKLHSFISGHFYSILRLYRDRINALPGRPFVALSEHRAILNAIEARDPEAAEMAMREHIRHARLDVIDYMSEIRTGGSKRRNPNLQNGETRAP